MKEYIPGRTAMKSLILVILLFTSELFLAPLMAAPSKKANWSEAGISDSRCLQLSISNSITSSKIGGLRKKLMKLEGIQKVQLILKKKHGVKVIYDSYKVQKEQVLEVIKKDKELAQSVKFVSDSKLLHSFELKPNPLGDNLKINRDQIKAEHGEKYID